MEARKLVKMANDIGSFFGADPDHAAALDGIASHLKRFWEPRMRRDLLSWVDGHAGEGLSPVVLEAIRTHRERIAPPAASPTAP